MAAVNEGLSGTTERRTAGERRSQTVRSLVAGGWHARRRNPRRDEPARIGSID